MTNDTSDSAYTRTKVGRSGVPNEKRATRLSRPLNLFEHFCHLGGFNPGRKNCSRKSKHAHWSD